jgi:hypothetical protein
MLGILAEGIKKVVKGIGIILMDILSEVDPEVFGSSEESKNVNEKQNLLLETSSNKKMSIKNENKLPGDDDVIDGFFGLPYGGLDWFFLCDDDDN